MQKKARDMPRKRPEPWNQTQIEKVRNLMTKFCSDPETICAVMDCRKDDLAYLCREAFGLNFKEAVKRFEMEGKATLKMAYFDAAVKDKNSKALDLMAREHLDMLGPVERRRKVAREVKAKQEETEF